MIFEFGKGVREAQRAHLMKSYTNWGNDIEKGGMGSGRHKVGDYVVDKNGLKGKVTHSDDKEIAVEHESGDMSGYTHDQVKKIEKSESMKVDKKEMIDEHKKLVGVLESPSHEDDKKEAKKQKKELEGYEGDVNKSESIDLQKAYEILGIKI